MLTGDVFANSGEQAEIGSVCMWLSGTFSLRKTDSIFNVVSMDDLLKEVNDNRSRGKDIVALLIGKLMRDLQRVRGFCSDGALVIELRRMKVSGTDDASINRIRSLRPSTISWSNVMDYCPPKAFHRMALSCSSPNRTRHFGYSMNWVRECPETCMLNYDGVAARRAIADYSHGPFMEALAKDNPELGSTFILPPFDHPLSTTTHVLARKYYGAWAERFFAQGEDIEVGQVSMSTLNPLCSTMAVAVYLSWAYSPSTDQ